MRALLVLLLALPAGAQTFQRQAGDAALTVRRAFAAYIKKRVPLPPPPAFAQQLPKRRVRAFRDGWDEALRLLRDEKDCRGLYAKHGFGFDEVVKTMSSTNYAFYDLGDASIGAETLDRGSVFINTRGLFVTVQDGLITLDRRHYDLGDASDVRAMILLHELGHQLGFFGPDHGPGLEQANAEHSLDVIRACIPGGAIPQIL